MAFEAYSATALSASQTVANFDAVRKGHILPKGGAALSETTGVYNLGSSAVRFDRLYTDGVGLGTFMLSTQVTFDAQATFTGSVSATIPAVPTMMVCKYVTAAGGIPQFGSSTAEIVQFNTTTMNTIDGATLTTNQFSLPSGAYFFKAYIQIQVSGNAPQSEFYLFNATDSLTTFQCGGPQSHSIAATQTQETELNAMGHFSLATTSSLEMRVAHTDARTVYFGPNPVFTSTATFNDGRQNVYQQIVFVRLT